MSLHAKFLANICSTKRVIGDKQNSKWRPSWIYDYCQFWLHPYFLLWLTTLQPNYINITQMAAELLVFVQKSKMVAAGILDLIFVQYSQSVRRIIKWVNVPNFVQLYAITTNKPAVGDKLNLRCRTVLHRFWLIHPCDGRTDGQTDRRTDRIAMAKTRWKQ